MLLHVWFIQKIRYAAGGSYSVLVICSCAWRFFQLQVRCITFMYLQNTFKKCDPFPLREGDLKIPRIHLQWAIVKATVGILMCFLVGHAYIFPTQRWCSVVFCLGFVWLCQCKLWAHRISARGGNFPSVWPLVAFEPHGRWIVSGCCCDWCWQSGCNVCTPAFMVSLTPHLKGLLAEIMALVQGSNGRAQFTVTCAICPPTPKLLIWFWTQLSTLRLNSPFFPPLQSPRSGSPSPPGAESCRRLLQDDSFESPSGKEVGASVVFICIPPSSATKSLIFFISVSIVQEKPRVIPHICRR